MEKNRRSMRAQPNRGQGLLQVPSLIRRRNHGSGQTSFGFLALLLWRARLLSKCESTVKSVAWQGIAEV
jgi:hypothetical protein